MCVYEFGEDEIATSGLQRLREDCLYFLLYSLLSTQVRRKRLLCMKNIWITLARQINRRFVTAFNDYLNKHAIDI